MLGDGAICRILVCLFGQFLFSGLELISGICLMVFLLRLYFGNGLGLFGSICWFSICIDDTPFNSTRYCCFVFGLGCVGFPLVTCMLLLYERSVGL